MWLEIKEGTLIDTDEVVAVKRRTDGCVVYMENQQFESTIKYETFFEILKNRIDTLKKIEKTISTFGSFAG